MNNLNIDIKLSDGSKIQVKDCEFDLLLHLLHKYKFDRNKIQTEIDWICQNFENSQVIEPLLKMSLQQFSSELINKIQAKSISEETDHHKIVEDMIIDINKIQYSIAESAKDIRKILQLRKKIFVDEEGYPNSAVLNGYEKDSLHLMATIRGELIGVVSIVFDGPKGLPLKKFIDLSAYKDMKLVEVDKLAMIGEKRKRELSFQLMWMCYSVAKFWGAEGMLIFTLSKKQDNLIIYERFGFKKIGEFFLFGNERATVLKLDFSDVDTYEKALNTQELLRLGKKLLKRFSLKVVS